MRIFRNTMSFNVNFLRVLSLTLVATALCGTSPTARAQDVGSSVVTAALGVPENPETGASPAVYLTWWPNGTPEWRPRSYAVYSKEGQPDDPGSFSLVAFVEPQTDALSVGFSLNRAQRVGEDLGALSNNIDGLYDKLVPVEGMPLAEKLAAIVSVSDLDPESAETLALLTRRHPAAALAAGVGLVDPIQEGAVRTYEIRSCPDGASSPGECDVVSGRVVVTGGDVRYLPAPGEPVHVPFVDEDGNPDPRGNLNVPLRWATPDPLRERSFFQFGYDVFRVSPKVAEQNDWDNQQPDRAMFLDLLRSKPEAIQRVNDLPILTEELFNATDVANLTADPETFFVIDDNGRYEEGGVPFTDGDTFYYFVAGRDLLGRPGEISEGTPVTVCSQIPPQAPRGLKVSNHYTWESSTDTQTQVFKLEWNEALPREDGPEIAGYWVYRWESVDEMHQMQGLPSSGLPGGSLTGGRIATVPAGTTEYIDNVGPHPFLTYSRGGDLETPAVTDHAEANKTYWYTVRAIDASACSGNVSGNSAPAYGVLRDRVGPDAPSGFVEGTCAEPRIDYQRTTQVGAKDETFDSRITYLRLSTQRFSPEIAWVEYYLDPLDDERSFLGRVQFPKEEGDIVTHSEKVRTARFYENEQTDAGRVFARVGTAGGRVSEFAIGSFVPGAQPDPKTGAFVQLVEFTAYIDKETDCGSHTPAPEDNSTGLVNPVDVTLNLTPGTEEWKLYRRVGDGSISLLRQGIGSYDDTPVVSIEDGDLPLNGGRICYFLQVFDRHGNPSPMTRLGCIVSGVRTIPTAPMLSPIQPIGEKPANGGARIIWFSPPDGIERFELWIRSADGFTDEVLSTDLRLHIPPPPMDEPLLSLRQDEVTGDLYRAYLTGRVGANFDAGPSFSVDWTENFSAGTEYFIRVRSIGPGGATSPWSNEENFLWAPEIDFSQPFDPGDCVVPWPVRGTPGVDGNFPVPEPEELFEVGLEAVMQPTNADKTFAYSGGAVRVGVVRLGSLDITLPTNWDRLSSKTDTGIFQLPGDEKGDLSSAFYQRQDGTSLLNFMLYRYQVPNAYWPSVSGDVYQVSPLIEGIAHTNIEFQGQPAKAIHDPYFFLLPIPETANSTRAYHLYVKDTQPVVRGASYRYLVVRFDDSGEIAQIIPLETVTAN